jgi:acyl-CoA synthetase (AMP-forming)/AMP-acid ligase II
MSIVEIVQQHAAQTPSKVAVVYLGDGDNITAQLSYQEIDHSARRVASCLQEHCVPGDRVLLVLPQGLDFVVAFLGCLYARVIAVPVPPLDPVRLKRTLPRVASILSDAQPSFVLTDLPGREALRPLLNGSPGSASVQCEAFDVLPLHGPAFRPPAGGYPAQDICYLQYTSGSTSAPKGVGISHGNIVAHCRAIQTAWHYSADSVAVSWMPNFHDYGLVDGLLQPLFTGFPCYLMSPVSFIRRPVRWLRAISRFGGTHTQAPNFAYDYCTRKITSAQMEGLDLRTWRVASNGAEQVRLQTLEAFSSKFAASGFRIEALHPAYGLAEATLLVATRSAVHPNDQMGAPRSPGRRPESEPPREPAGLRGFVSCGLPVDATEVAIVDPESLRACPENAVGEIWVRGPGVATGYWGRPEETEQVFRARRADGTGPFLRTGDLGFLHSGELYVTGRRKDLIVIDGANHYPQDIEFTVQGCHELIRNNCIAAFAVERHGQESLAVVAEITAPVHDPDSIVSVIRRSIAEQHELSVDIVALVRPGTVLKTSSGKVRRQANRAMLLARQVEILGGLNCD